MNTLYVRVQFHKSNQEQVRQLLHALFDIDTSRFPLIDETWYGSDDQQRLIEISRPIDALKDSLDPREALTIPEIEEKIRVLEHAKGPDDTFLIYPTRWKLNDEGWRPGY